jgi:glutathione S-transferase
MAVHIALHETGAPFEAHRLSFWKGEQKAPDYLAINREGKVPTLVINGEALSEVAACLYYLARAYPKSNLFPRDDITRQAQVISWMSFNAARLHPSRNQGVDTANEVTELADARLGDRIWAAGEYSIADIHLFRLYWRFKNSFQPPEGRFANLDAHYARMMKRPAVIKTIEIESALGYEYPENKPR